MDGSVISEHKGCAARIAELEQHIAELERSLESARKERNEWRQKAMDAESHPVVLAMRQEREAARADKAALMERGNRLYDLAQHDEACKMFVGDDLAMCDCAMGEWQQVQRDSHPGAALLEEHRKEVDTAYQKGRDDERAFSAKALVRARNEGLEKAAQRCIEACPGVAQEGCPCDACALTRSILALKEADEGGQS